MVDGGWRARDGRRADWRLESSGVREGYESRVANRSMAAAATMAAERTVEGWKGDGQ
jgi:hypothetical protein